MPNPILDHMQVTGTNYDIKDASAVHTVDGEAPDQYGNVNAGKVYVANEFSTSTSYTTGQYAIYEQKLYRFIADHTAGAWNSAHVEQKKLANVVSDLSNVVDEFGITIQVSDWSNSSPYTYTYTDARILQQSSVYVAYTNNSTDTTAFWIDYEVPVGGGGIVFTADDKPTGSIGVCVKILNTEATLSIQSRAEDISTEAVSGAENVEEALSTLNGRVGNVPSGQNLQSQVTANKNDISDVEGGIAYIVGNTNTTGGALAVGQFVYVKGHSTIDNGLRKVTASISANASITTSNTSPCPEGGLNALNGNISTINSNISTINSNISTINGSINQNIVSGSDLNDYKTTGIWRIGNMSALINKATVSGVGTTGILYVIKIGNYILQDFPNNGVRATRFSFDGGSSWDSWH